MSISDLWEEKLNGNWAMTTPSGSHILVFKRKDSGMWSWNAQRKGSDKTIWAEDEFEDNTLAMMNVESKVDMQGVPPVIIDTFTLANVDFTLGFK